MSDPDRRYLAYFLGTAPGGKALRPLPYLAAAGAVVLALAGGLAVERYLGAQSVLLIFLMAILASAVTWGLFPSLLACVLSVLTYNFFFLSPIYTFAIAEPENAVALVFFFLVAVVASSLAAATRSQTEIARARAGDQCRALQFQRQARRHRHARRGAVGHRLSDRVDAAGADRAADAGRAKAGSSALPEAIRPRTGSTARRWRRRSNAGARTARSVRPGGCSCRCAPAAARSG